MESILLVKTRKGQEELAQRSGALSQKQRSMLILVDGKTPSSTLINRCAFFSNCSEQLNWLLEQGYIEPCSAVAKASRAVPSGQLPTSPAAATSAREALIALAQTLLGNHAGTVVRRLQESPDNPDALKATLERCHKLIRLSIDERKAEHFLQQGTSLLTVV